MASVPETTDPGDRVLAVPVSRIKSRALRRVTLVALYPVLMLFMWALLPFAVLRKVVLFQIGLTRQTARIWRLP